MAKSKYLGTLREMISSIAGDIVQVNEDLEVISLSRAVKAGKFDLIPRIYAIPEAELKVTCKATLKAGKVKMFGLGGSSDQEEMIEITVNIPLRVIPPTADQVQIIVDTTEEDVRRKLAERQLRGELNGSTFVPDITDDSE